MNSNLDQTVLAIAALAEKHGVREALDIARALLTSTRHTLVVDANPAGATLFRDAVLTGAQLVRLEDLLRDHTLALTSSPVVLVFRCGQYLSAEEVSFVEQVFFARPPDTYAFVFAGAATADPSEIEVLERSAWRLLVPEPKPRWANQELSEYGIFLWDSTSHNEDSGRRFAQAASTIKTLGRNPESRDKLSALALGLAIRKIRSELENQMSTAASHGSDRDAQQLREAQREMVALHRRLTRNADSEAHVFATTLDTSVLHLRNDLLAGLGAALRTRSGRSLNTPSREEMRRNLQEYLSKAVNQWLSTTKSRIAGAADEIIADASSSIRLADWATANRAAEKTGEAPSWPNRLLERLSKSGDVAPGGPELGPYGTEPKPRVPRPEYAIGGAGVVLTLGLIAGPIPALVTSILLGAAGWHIYHEGGIREYEQYGRGIIFGATEHMSVQVEQFATSAMKRHRSVLDEEFAAVEALLTKAGLRPDTQAIPEAADLNLLDALETSLLATKAFTS